MNEQLEFDTPLRQQQLAFGRAAADLVDRCTTQGLRIPFTIAMVGRNGVVVAVRTGPDAKSIVPILEYYPDRVAAYPVTVIVVDRGGEVSPWTLEENGTLSRPPV